MAASQQTPSPEAQQLLDEAAADYAKHQDPATQTAAREQRAWAQVHGNAAAGAERSH